MDDESRKRGKRARAQENNKDTPPAQRKPECGEKLHVSPADTTREKCHGHKGQAHREHTRKRRNDKLGKIRSPNRGDTDSHRMGNRDCQRTRIRDGPCPQIDDCGNTHRTAHDSMLRKRDKRFHELPFRAVD